MKKAVLALCLISLFAASVASVSGQAPVIASFSRDGELVCTNLLPGSAATWEWAPAVTGPWNSVAAGPESLISDSNGVSRVVVSTTNTVTFFRVRGVPGNPDPARLAWIAPGTFTMGSPASEAERWEDETEHEVTLSHGFWMGKHEVTQEEYSEIMLINPSYFPGTNGPVEAVSWFDAAAYCALLAERERAAGRLPDGYVYRLPTEAEWEFACRAGTTTAFHHGAALASGMANFNGTAEYVASVGTIENPDGVYLGRPSAVGSYAPNAWGLHDMHGNVWEWCLDRYDTYPEGSATDPAGPNVGSERVFRGGSWASLGAYTRSAERSFDTPDRGFPDLGLRVVLGRPAP